MVVAAGSRRAGTRLPHRSRRSCPEAIPRFDDFPVRRLTGVVCVRRLAQVIHKAGRGPPDRCQPLPVTTSELKHAARPVHPGPVAGVDTNPGTSAAPFRTLQKALSKGVVAPGDTINLKPGNYNEAVATQVPGTQAAPITIKGPGTGKVADPAVQAVLRGLGGRVFSINHSWYTLTGLDIDGQPNIP